MSQEQTFVYALEIERAVVCVLWRKAPLLEAFHARCDLEAHLTEPRLRIILGAIELAYGELGADLNAQISPLEGASDWPVVVSVIREMGQFDECGGLAGLNEVYSAHEPGPHTAAIFNDYLRLLCQYALARAEQTQKVAIFTGGKGVLEPNKIKRYPLDPDFVGAARVAAKSYSMRAWSSPSGAFLNLSFQPK